MKEITTPEELTKGLPCTYSLLDFSSASLASFLLLDNFLLYFRYLQTLHFSDKPDYDFMRSLFLDVLEEMEEPFDNDFDWTPANNEPESDS